MHYDSFLVFSFPPGKKHSTTTILAYLFVLAALLKAINDIIRGGALKYRPTPSAFPGVLRLLSVYCVRLRLKLNLYTRKRVPIVQDALIQKPCIDNGRRKIRFSWIKNTATGSLSWNFQNIVWSSVTGAVSREFPPVFVFNCFKITEKNTTSFSKDYKV